MTKVTLSPQYIRSEGRRQGWWAGNSHLEISLDDLFGRVIDRSITVFAAEMGRRRHDGLLFLYIGNNTSALDLQLLYLL